MNMNFHSLAKYNFEFCARSQERFTRLRKSQNKSQFSLSKTQLITISHFLTRAPKKTATGHPKTPKCPPKASQKPPKGSPRAPKTTPKTP